MIKIALTYKNKYGFSVIPLGQNKKPFFSLLPKNKQKEPIWEPFQTRQATDEEIEGWWTKEPKALIGIVTGRISGIAVIDIDSKLVSDIPLAFKEYTDIPTVSTPRGFHFYFKYHEGITNTVNIGGKKVDIRGEGGYVVAPPSKLENGKQYKWIFSLQKGLPEFPLQIFGQPGSQLEKRNDNSVRISGETFIEGRRDNDIFHLACNLVRGGTPEHEIRQAISKFAQACDPPFPEKEAQIKVDSALKRGGKRDRRWEAEVTEWVHDTSGYFSLNACYSDLGAFSVNEKSSVRNTLKRLKDKGVIESHPLKSGFYRRFELECEPLDWRNAPTNDVDIKFPFDIHKKVKIFKSNIIVVAGFKSAGKTAFLLNFIKLNMNEHEIHYFNSEMGSSELRLRLGLFADIKESEWNFKSWERKSNFAEVIKPNKINVIDYIEITDNHWMIGKYLQDIDAKLGEGIAIVALQKPWGRDIARGGESSLDKPRLYLAMNPGEIKIVDAKNWRGTDNPNGEVMEFKLFSGSEFHPTPPGFWKKPDFKKEEK